MPTIQTGSHRVYYDEYGTGHPLLLIPGLSNSRLSWWKQIEPLFKKYRVINMDNRDAGDSALGTGPYTIADMADDAAGLIQSLHLNTTYVVGWSMGGFIALELTLRHPGLVKKLILVSTSAGGPTQIPPTPEIAALLVPVENEDIETNVRRIYPSLAAPGYMQSHPEDLYQVVHNAKAKPMRLESYQRQLGAVMAWGGVSHRLNQITAPTLVLHGDADSLIPYGNGQHLSTHIQGAKFLTYTRVGHLPPIEAPERFNRDVTDFLTGTCPASPAL
jgi:pimeloyl-ACP methyl ester carboxylesterase